MTSQQKQRFESQWPAIAARLERLLARRSIPVQKRDDIVQETGLRLLGSWDKVDSARPLWPFVVTIALNLMRDEARRATTGTEIPCELPDQQDWADVEHAGLVRLELRRAGRALALLKPGHRDVLLAELDPSLFSYEGTAAATKMLRARARRRLAALMQNVSALGVAATGPIRRAARSGHLIPFRGAAEGIAPAMCGVLCAFVAIGGLSLAPFSFLPRTEGNLVDRGGMTLSAEPAHGDRTEGREAVDDAFLRRAGTGNPTTHAGWYADDDGWGDRPSPSGGDGSISHQSHYGVPLGNESLANGTITAEVSHGSLGEGLPQAPDGNESLDCSEQMVTPGEIDVRCWWSDDPEHKYGLRVSHDGENFLGVD